MAWPVLKVQAFVEQVHSLSGLPWWAAIMCVTIVSRVLVMPVNISSLRNSLRLKRIIPQVADLQTQMSNVNEPEERRLQAARQLRELFRLHHCSPLHHLWVPLVFPAVFLSYFGAVHNLCLAESTMATEGTLWFTNLMTADPTYLLPILSSLTWLWTVQLGGGTLYRTWPGLRTLAKTVAMASIPIVSTLPAGVFLFWIPANLYAVIRSYVMQSDAVRRCLAIPTVEEIRQLKHLPRPVPAAEWPEGPLRRLPIRGGLRKERRAWHRRARALAVTAPPAADTTPP
jgi:YidC/Oxa1 family membrane protein insertase